MSDLRELYQELILDHSKRPRNFGRPAAANREARGHNPLCGDRLTVYATVEGEAIRELAFEGEGCAISKASASMMTELLKGKPVAEARALFERFHGVVTGTAGELDALDLDKAAVFSGVRDYPVRVKCATLPWHTLVAALDRPGSTVKTE